MPAFSLVLLFSLAHLCAAQNGNFSITSWDTHNGLPEALVQALAINPEDGVWVATEGGLCLFGGSNCVSLPSNQARKFPQSSITALLIGHDGSLWVGTEGGGLLHIGKGQVESFTRASGLSDGYVRAICEDSRGTLWVGTDSGLFEKKRGIFQSVPLAGTAQPQFVHAIVEDRSGDLVVGGRSLTIISNGSAASVDSWSKSGRPQIKSLLVSEEGNLIIGTVNGAYAIENGQPHKLPLPAVDIESLCQSRDGAIWAGTVSDGLWRIKDHQVSRVGFMNGGTPNTVLAMTTDPQGRLWVGTQRGLSRIEASAVRFVSSPVRAVDRETIAVSPKGEANLVNGDVFRIEGDTLRPLRFPIDPGIHILDALYASDRSVWLGTGGDGVFHIGPRNRVSQYSTRSRLRLSTDYPRGFMEGAHGEIWVATEFGVNVIRGGTIERLGVPEGLPSRAVRTLFRDSRGCMWIGTDRGPAVSCDGTMVQNQITTALDGVEIWAITQDPSGTLWFGTRRDGIYAFGDFGSRHLTVANGLPSGDICGLVVDRTGNLWISSLDQIFSISAAQIAAMKNGRPFLIPRSYVLPNQAEGLRFTRGRILSAALDAQGTVWFATDHGPVSVDRLRPLPEKVGDGPRPIIQSIVADNSILPPGARVKTTPSPHRLAISLGSDYLGPARDTLLMYRLDGVDENWIIADSGHRAEYGNLAAGTYRFELRSCDRTVPLRWKTITCTIVVPLVWYRSRWFSAALVLTILTASWLVYFQHLRRLRYGFHLILGERNRVAREMHDTLIQGCNGVAMLLEAEASTREGSNGSQLLSAARDQLRATVTDARAAVWNLRQSHSDPNYLADTLRSVASHATSFFGLTVDVRLPRRIPVLPAGVAHELLMIVREAVTNAGTHGSPHRVEVKLETTREGVTIEIADDGIGFDPESASSQMKDHYGIRGMRERAKSIGASFSISSSPHKGTTVRVSRPVTEGIVEARSGRLKGLFSRYADSKK